MRISILACTLVAACTGANASVAVGSHDWLVGYWMPAGEDCESDAGVAYSRDGSWTAYGAAGKWAIVDREIRAVVTEQWDDGGDVQTLAAPKSHVEKLSELGPDKFVSHWEDGTVVTLRRCPRS